MDLRYTMTTLIGADDNLRNTWLRLFRLGLLFNNQLTYNSKWFNLLDYVSSAKGVFLFDSIGSHIWFIWVQRGLFNELSHIWLFARKPSRIFCLCDYFSWQALFLNYLKDLDVTLICWKQLYTCCNYIIAIPNTCCFLSYCWEQKFTIRTVHPVQTWQQQELEGFPLQIIRI